MAKSRSTTRPRHWLDELTDQVTIANPTWRNHTVDLHQHYLRWSDPAALNPPGELQMSSIMQTLRARLPQDAIMTNGAGNYATWLQRFHRFQRYGTQLAPTSESMGYGLPAAIAAKRCFPQRTVAQALASNCSINTWTTAAIATHIRTPALLYNAALTFIA